MKIVFNILRNRFRTSIRDKKIKTSNCRTENNQILLCHYQYWSRHILDIKDAVLGIWCHTNLHDETVHFLLHRTLCWCPRYDILQLLLFLFVILTDSDNICLQLGAPHFENLTDALPSIDDKIIGGNTTTIQEYPYQLSLRINGRHDCGASVLTVTRALSAAYCVRRGATPSNYSIKAGSTFRLDEPHDPNAQIRTLSRFIRHPEYTDTPVIRHDIAVLHWVRPLVFSAIVRPIILAVPRDVVPYGRLGVTSGWGLTAPGQLPLRLQAVATPFVTNAQCNRSYGGQIAVDMICAGFPQGGRGACDADIGGPLVDRSVQHRFVQFGVVSWGRGCAQPNFPTVYARVSAYTAWIRRNS